ATRRSATGRPLVFDAGTPRRSKCATRRSQRLRLDDRRTGQLALPRIECAQRASIGEVFAQELPQQTLMRSRPTLVERRDRVGAAEPSIERDARIRRQHAAKSCGARTGVAKRASRRMAERGQSIERDGLVTVGAVLYPRSESELGHEMP